ncbi:MAG: PEP-CTERM sorting domain-containing protein [Pseudomonadota bacterium]
MQRNAIGLLVLLSGAIGNAAIAMPVYQDSVGREWLDLNDSRYRSWDEIAAVCSAASGECSGTLASTGAFSGDLDVTGYRWASRNEVRDLFYEVAGLPSGSLDDFSATFSAAAGYGANVFGTFEPTIQFGIGPGIMNVMNGVTRDLYAGIVFNASTGFDSSTSADTFTLTGQLPVDMREISMGVYLYKTAVPEPGTFALFAAGLLGLVIVGKRGRTRVARQPARNAYSSRMPMKIERPTYWLLRNAAKQASG